MYFLLAPSSVSNLVFYYNYQDGCSDVSSGSSCIGDESPPKLTYEQYMDRSYDRYMNLPRLSRDMSYNEYMNCMYGLEVHSSVVATETTESSVAATEPAESSIAATEPAESSVATETSDDSVVHRSVLLPQVVNQIIIAAGGGALSVAAVAGRITVDCVAYALVRLSAHLLYKYLNNLE